MHNLSLYQQHLDLVHLMNQAEIELAESSCVSAETEALISEALTNIPAKVDRCVGFVEWCDFQHDYLAHQIDVLKGQQESLRNAQDRMKKAVLATMTLTGEKALKGDLRGFGIKKSEAVEVLVEPATLPASLIRTKTTIEADKPAIKNALKSGQVVEGCKLVVRESVVCK